MKIWKQVLEIFRKPLAPAVQRSNKEAYLKKYQLFRELLSNNNKAIELMADMEERLSGEAPLDRYQLCGRIAEIAGKVKIIMDTLNLISKDKYSGLYVRFNEITAHMGTCLAKKEDIPVSDYTAPFDKITKDLKLFFGNKNANIGEVRNRLKIPTPDGFAVSTYAFLQFMEHKHLFERIGSILSVMRAGRGEHIEALSQEIRGIIVKAEIHPHVERAIKQELEALCKRISADMENILVSVRSSALYEDGEFSFAGQYATFLNVPPDLVLQRYKEVVASLFAPGALLCSLKMFSAGYGQNISGSTDPAFEVEGALRNMVMSVGVLLMVNAQSAGVIYSEDPNNPGSDVILISAVPGLGKSLVDGTETPETYSVSRDLEVLKAEMPEQNSAGSYEHGEEAAELKRQRCLNDEQLRTLARYAAALEEHYSYPQDIEWAIDRDEKVYILQTRPLKMNTEAPGNSVPIFKEHHILLDKGVIASKGIGFGKAFILRTEEDVRNFPEGAVIVAKHASTKLTAAIDKASAIVTDVGAATVHMATIAREFQVPAIVDTEIATEVIRSGQEITVDAFNGIVYEGRVKELFGFLEKRRTPFKETGLHGMFAEVLRKIIPLNLVDPGNELFTPEHCRTLHDIIRFAHQKAMLEMFKISKEFPEDVEAVKLLGGIPLLIYVIDLGSGLSTDVSGSVKAVGPENVTSIPFNAFFRGLASAVWPEPRHIDAAGFMGMMAHTASIPETELERMGEKSFAFIAAEYMNFSINLGYHISVVEAFAGENINDNYIKMFFKGGGADLGRRMRRVTLISEVLRRTDFDVRVTEDVIQAVITKDRKASLEKKLGVLGRLTVYTKQLDAIMPDNSTVDLYLEEFIEKYFPSSEAAL